MTERTVLVVDDEPDILTIARLAMATVGGWSVLTATTGAEALRLAEEHRPEVVLLDVMLPDLDGPSVLTEMRKKAALRTLPVAFMTARVQRHEVDRYLKLGAVGVVHKPFDPMRLSREVEAMCTAASKVWDPSSPPLEEVRARFRASLPAKADELAAAAEDVDRVRVLAHRLSGSAGSYGLHQLGALADRVQVAIDEGEEYRAPLGRLMAALRADDGA